MGLDTSHDCWHGAYSAFMRWRIKLADVAGFPPLMLMDGFFEGPSQEALKWAAPRDGGPLCKSPLGPSLHGWIERYTSGLPVRWDYFAADPLTVLLNHSDADGSIDAKDCGPLADRLTELLPKLADEDGGGHIWNWRGTTQRFIDGLRLASAAGENVEFH